MLTERSPQFTMFLLNLGHIPNCALCLHMNWREVYSPRTAIYDFIEVSSPNTWVQQCNSHAQCRAEQLGLEQGRHFQKAPLMAEVSGCSPRVIAAGFSKEQHLAFPRKEAPSSNPVQIQLSQWRSKKFPISKFFFKTVMHYFYLIKTAKYY